MPKIVSDVRVRLSEEQMIVIQALINKTALKFGKHLSESLRTLQKESVTKFIFYVNFGNKLKIKIDNAKMFNIYMHMLDGGPKRS